MKERGRGISPCCKSLEVIFFIIEKKYQQFETTRYMGCLFLKIFRYSWKIFLLLSSLWLMQYPTHIATIKRYAIHPKSFTCQRNLDYFQLICHKKKYNCIIFSSRFFVSDCVCVCVVLCCVLVCEATVNAIFPLSGLFHKINGKPLREYVKKTLVIYKTIFTGGSHLLFLCIITFFQEFKEHVNKNLPFNYQIMKGVQRFFPRNIN